MWIPLYGVTNHIIFILNSLLVDIQKKKKMYKLRKLHKWLILMLTGKKYILFNFRITNMIILNIQKKKKYILFAL